MKPLRNANFCCQCESVFHSTDPFPERCSICLSPEWDHLKKYPEHTLFDELEGYEE